MDPLSFLYIALGVGFLVLVIFISVVLLYTIPMLRDLNAITRSAKEVVTRVNEIALHPLQIMNQVMESIKPMIEHLRDHKRKSKE